MDFRDNNNNLTLGEVIKTNSTWSRKVEFYHESSNTIIQGEVINEIVSKFREEDVIGFDKTAFASSSVDNSEWYEDFEHSLIELHMSILNHTNVLGED